MATAQKQTTDTIRSQTHHGVTWLDVHRPDAQTFAQLEHDYHLHPVHLKESVQKVQHTQVEREDGYLFMVLHFPVYNARTDKIQAGQVGVFLGKNFLITVHTDRAEFLEEVFAGCHSDADQAAQYFKHSAAYLLYILIRSILENMLAMAEMVEGQLDAIESLVFENSSSDAQRIGRIRQKIIRLRRLVGPKRLVLQDLAEQIGPFADKSMTRYYSNNVKTVNKLWEMVEEAKETIEVYKDADFTTSTEKTNKILMLLTLAFTFTIPVTVVGTLYGMNVLLPGGIEAGSWLFLGRFTTFGLIAATSIAFAVSMFIYFKRKKWF